MTKPTSSPESEIKPLFMGSRVAHLDGTEGTVEGVRISAFLRQYATVRWDNGSFSLCPTSILTLLPEPTP